MRDMQVYVEQARLYRSLNLYIAEKVYDEELGEWIRKQYTENGLMEIDSVHDKTPPPIRISYAAGQELADKLWQCGIRPTEGAGTAGAMAQAQEHIKSLQEQIKNLWALLNNKES